MPFTPAPQKKCQRCAKSVYQAEEKKDSTANRGTRAASRVRIAKKAWTVLL